MSEKELKIAREGLLDVFDSLFRSVEIDPYESREALRTSALKLGRDRAFFLRLGKIREIDQYDRFLAWKRAAPERRAVTAMRTHERRHPQGRLAAQVLGPEGSRDHYWGLERALRSDLAGRDGLRRVGRTGIRQTYYRDDESEVVQGHDGEDVVLTLESKVQVLLESIVEETKQKWDAKSATAVVMDPVTGAILGVASAPRFSDPADSWLRDGKITEAEHVDRCKLQFTQLNYQPGSTVKPLFYAEARLRGLDPGRRVKDQEGLDRVFQIGKFRRRIVDVTRRGPLTAAEAVVYSSNIGLVNIGLWLGEGGLKAALDRFELGRPTGIQLRDEQAGLVPHRRRSPDWTLWTTTSVPTGYEVMVTPLQILRAYSAIANGGRMARPHLVRSLGGRTLTHPGRDDVLTPEIARELREVLRTAVVQGAITHPDLEEVGALGWGLAGKTGTAKKESLDPVTGKWGYTQPLYRSSFIGMAPVENPRYLMMMVVDEPQGQYYGSVVARPAAAKVLASLLGHATGVFRARLERLWGNVAENRGSAGGDTGVDGSGGPTRIEGASRRGGATQEWKPDARTGRLR